jgi:hypothetical protein
MMMLKGLLGTIRELFQFLLARRLFWLVPMVAMLLLFAGLIILGSTGIAPFIYTLF